MPELTQQVEKETQVLNNSNSQCLNSELGKPALILWGTPRTETRGLLLVYEASENFCPEPQTNPKPRPGRPVPPATRVSLSSGHKVQGRGLCSRCAYRISKGERGLSNRKQEVGGRRSSGHLGQWRGRGATGPRSRCWAEGGDTYPGTGRPSLVHRWSGAHSGHRS